MQHLWGACRSWLAAALTTRCGSLQRQLPQSPLQASPVTEGSLELKAVDYIISFGLQLGRQSS
ncbi:hypothetical protein OFB78_29240 [Escherichia coli]|nr:hypothetical protein [Escherichia coli]